MTYPGRDLLPRRPKVKKLADGQDGNEGAGFWYEQADGRVILAEGSGAAAGLWEPLVAINGDGDSEIVFAANADGFIDIVMVWRTL